MNANSSIPRSTACSRADERHVLLVQYILGGWVSLVIVLFGLFSNGLSILILGNRRMRYLSTNVYLLALSIVNLVWLCLYLAVQTLRFTLIIPKFLSSPDENDHHGYDDFVQRSSPYIVPLMNTLQLCSIYYTVAVSFDRFLYLSYGLQAETICTVRNSLRSIAGITLFSILFILPHWFKHRVEWNEKEGVRLKLTSIGENRLFREIIHIWLYIPVVYALPFLLLIVINFFTIKLLHQFYRSRRTRLRLTSALSIHHREHHERGVTLMLIGVVVLFFICRFPMLINHIFETRSSLTTTDNRQNPESNNDEYTSTSTEQCRSRRFFNTIVNCLQTINASANLIVYYAFGQTFRDTSVQLARLVRKRAIRRRDTLTQGITYFVQRRRASAMQQSQGIDQQEISNPLQMEQCESLNHKSTENDTIE